MDSESKSRDRKSFDKASEGAKKPNYLLQLPRSGNRQALDDLFASSSSPASLRALLHTWTRTWPGHAPP